MEPKVSIILTSYNKPWFVGKAIESILLQTFTDWELFIMDDHSDEKTEQTIKQFLHDSRIKYRNSYIEKEKRYETTRYASQINEAIPLTKGKYITYITDDTIYVPSRLSEMVQFLDSDPSIEIVYSSQHVKVVGSQLNSLREFKREAVHILKDAAGIVDHCSVMHTRKIAEIVREEHGNYWDEDPLHWTKGDAIFWRRLNEFQPFYPLSNVLDITYKTPQSVQTMFRHLPNRIPNGTIVKGIEPEIYMIENGERRLLTEEMITYFKYDIKKIVEIPNLFLFQYEEGNPINDEFLPNFSLIQDEKGNMFYLERNQKRRIEHLLVLKKFKFNLNRMIQMNSSRLENIPAGPDLKMNFSIRLPENKVYINHHQFWLMENDRFFSIEKKVMERLKMLDNPIPIPGNIIKQSNVGEPILSLDF